MAAFINSFGSGAPAGAFIDGGLLGSTGGVTIPFAGALNKSSETGSAPKAYLNYVVFDRDFNFKDGGYVRVTTAAREYGQDAPHEELAKELVITEPGYVYLYISNDNVSLGGGEVEVYWDDFRVEHVKSLVVGSQDYYPFGLSFNSYNRESSLRNQYLFNKGAERQDELGLEIDLTKFRAYDPAMGRWWQSDPLADEGTLVSLTPYNYSGNDPIRYNDPDGDCPWCVGALFGAAVDYGLQVTTNLAQGKDLSSSLTDVDVGSILVSAGAGAVSGGLSTISKLKSAANLTKLAVDVAVDASASVAGQVVRDGEVSVTKTVVDIVGSQTIGKTLGNVAKNNAVNSQKGKALQAEVNHQVNISKGKSNTTPKSKADVAGAQKKLDNFVEKKAISTGTASSGAASTIVEAIDDKDRKKK